jgi:hypothetical protein
MMTCLGFRPIVEADGVGRVVSSDQIAAPDRSRFAETHTTVVAQ